MDDVAINIFKRVRDLYRRSADGCATMKHVLIIDDNPNAIELMAHYLRLEGIAVVSASSAEHGLQVAIDEEPDLIICDIRMPGMDGLAFAQKVKTIPRLSDIPLIAVTAYVMQSDHDKAMNAGFEMYITKPIDTRSFARDVKRMMESTIK